MSTNEGQRSRWELDYEHYIHGALKHYSYLVSFFSYTGLIGWRISFSVCCHIGVIPAYESAWGNYDVASIAQACCNCFKNLISRLS